MDENIKPETVRIFIESESIYYEFGLLDGTRETAIGFSQLPRMLAKHNIIYDKTKVMSLYNHEGKFNNFALMTETGTASILYR